MAKKSKKKGGLTGVQWHSMLKQFSTEEECFIIPDYVWVERIISLDQCISKYRGEHFFRVNIERHRAGVLVLRGRKVIIAHKSILERLLEKYSIELIAFISQGNAIPFEYADIRRYKARAKEIRNEYNEELQKTHEQRMSNDPEYAARHARAEKRREWIAKTQKENKKKATESEKLLYKTALKRFGKRVKPQFEITVNGHIYFIDFFIKSMCVAIEVDGGYHSTPEQSAKDMERDANLASIGIKTIRIKNYQVPIKSCITELLSVLRSRKKTKGKTPDRSVTTYHIGL